MRGRRVVLRDWTHGDVKAFVHWQRPDHTWRDFDGPYYRPPSTEETARKADVLRTRIDGQDWPTPRVVLPITVDDELIGQVSRYWQSEETQWLSLGVAIYDPDNWNRGLAYEALGLWCEYQFEAAPALRRLDLRTWSGNLGMMRLAEKLGFTQEACFRQARTVRGEIYDGLGYGILRSEWRDRHPHGFAIADDT